MPEPGVLDTGCGGASFGWPPLGRGGLSVGKREVPKIKRLQTLLLSSQVCCKSLESKRKHPSDKKLT
jgi:hypothetical protein